jgi:hypothetical protein
MDKAAGPKLPAQMTTEEYRKHYREEHKEFLRTAKKEYFMEIIDFIIKPRPVDMKTFTGTDQEMTREIEYLYANDGR